MTISAIEVAQALLCALTYPAVVFDSQSQAVLWNVPAEQLFGLQKGTSYKSEDLPFSDMIQQWLAKEGSHLDWAPRLDVIYSPHVVSMNEDEGKVLLLRDVSEVRKLMRNQNEFIRLISHDLRSPLTSTLGFAGMLEQQVAGDLNEKQAYFVSKIMTGIEALTKLVENIQDAGRFDPETGFYEMNRQLCDVGDIVRRVAEHHIVPAEKQNVKVEVTIDEQIPIIAVDSNMIERAVVNLIDNAIKYTPDGGHVIVQAQRTEDQLVISVKDDGFGISPEDQQRLFHRHVRLHRQEFKKIKGSGLGLFIVRSVAQRHEGRAWVESELGQGSTFFIALPLRAS